MLSQPELQRGYQASQGYRGGARPARATRGYQANQGYRGGTRPARGTEEDPVSNMYLEATWGNLVKSSDSITDRQAWHEILPLSPLNCITGLGLRSPSCKTRTIRSAAGGRGVECGVRLRVAYNTAASGNLRSPYPPASLGTRSSFRATS